MRIGFEAKRATHNSRGLGNYSRGLIEGLLETGFNDHLYLYTPDLDSYFAKRWIDSLSSNAHPILPSTLVGKTFKGLWRSHFVLNELLHDNLDLYHGLSHELPIGKFPFPVKKIVTIHDLIFLRYPQFFSLIDRWIFFQKVAYACKEADLIIAICEQTKKDLVHFLNIPEQKIKIHYQSCSPLFYESVSPDLISLIKDKYKIKRSYILNVGAFEPRKNQLTLIEAFHEISSQVDVDLVLIGKGKDYLAKAKEKTLSLKLSDRVHFLESVTHTELPGFYQAADVFCFPSLFEGFGIPIVEALYSKVPIITSLGSCFPESAGPQSIFVDPLSPGEIANALLRLYEQPILRNEMIVNGLEYAKRFHRGVSTLELRGLYAELIG